MENKNNKINIDSETKVYEQKPIDFSHTLEVAATCINVNAYLILRKGEKILLHFRKNTGYCDNFYGLVSGHVEHGESATTAMIREAYEEVGIHLKLDSLKAVHVLHRKTNRLNIDIFFECCEWQGEITNREPNKCGGLDFFALCDLPSNTIDYIKVTLKAIHEGIFYSESGWK